MYWKARNCLRSVATGGNESVFLSIPTLNPCNRLSLLAEEIMKGSTGSPSSNNSDMKISPIPVASSTNLEKFHLSKALTTPVLWPTHSVPVSNMIWWTTRLSSASMIVSTEGSIFRPRSSPATYSLPGMGSGSSSPKAHADMLEKNPASSLNSARYILLQTRSGSISLSCSISDRMKSSISSFSKVVAW